MRRRGKYNVSPKSERTFGELVFDSKLEMRRYLVLLKMQEQGHIKDLEFHTVSFDITILSSIGKPIILFRYEPDFKYTTLVAFEWKRTKRGKPHKWSVGDVVYEDSKGKPTVMFACKRKAMLIQHNIVIYETGTADAQMGIKIK